MNHCIIEPPLDRRGEGEEEAGRAQGWMGDGGREGGRGGERWEREMRGKGKEMEKDAGGKQSRGEAKAREDGRGRRRESASLFVCSVQQM